MLKALLVALCVPAVALAQDLTPPPLAAADPALPSEFLERALKVDKHNRITEGKAGKDVTHRELFQRLGRTDLLAQSDQLASRRKWLIVSSIALAVAGGVAGGVLIATAPKLASVQCESDIRIYNDVCVPRAAQHNVAGTAVIVTGVVGALLMATFAYWSDPNVLDRDGTSALVSTFNTQLARTLRRAPSGLRVLPFVTPEGASLTASLRF